MHTNQYTKPIESYKIAPSTQQKINSSINLEHKQFGTRIHDDCRLDSIDDLENNDQSIQMSKFDSNMKPFRKQHSQNPEQMQRRTMSIITPALDHKQIQIESDQAQSEMMPKTTKKFTSSSTIYTFSAPLIVYIIACLFIQSSNIYSNFKATSSTCLSVDIIGNQTLYNETFYHELDQINDKMLNLSSNYYYAFAGIFTIYMIVTVIDLSMQIQALWLSFVYILSFALVLLSLTTFQDFAIMFVRQKNAVSRTSSQELIANCEVLRNLTTVFNDTYQSAQFIGTYQSTEIEDLSQQMFVVILCISLYATKQLLKSILPKIGNNIHLGSSSCILGSAVLMFQRNTTYMIVLSIALLFEILRSYSGKLLVIKQFIASNKYELLKQKYHIKWISNEHIVQIVGVAIPLLILSGLCIDAAVNKTIVIQIYIIIPAILLDLWIQGPINDQEGMITDQQQDKDISEQQTMRGSVISNEYAQSETQYSKDQAYIPNNMITLYTMSMMKNIYVKQGLLVDINTQKGFDRIQKIRQVCSIICLIQLVFFYSITLYIGVNYMDQGYVQPLISSTMYFRISVLLAQFIIYNNIVYRFKEFTQNYRVISIIGDTLENEYSLVHCKALCVIQILFAIFFSLINTIYLNRIDNVGDLLKDYAAITVFIELPAQIQMFLQNTYKPEDCQGFKITNKEVATGIKNKPDEEPRQTIMKQLPRFNKCSGKCSNKCIIKWNQFWMASGLMIIQVSIVIAWKFDIMLSFQLLGFDHFQLE